MSGNKWYMPVYDQLTEPPVSNTDDLIHMMDDLSANMKGLMEGLTEFAEWLKRADVDEHVWDMVEKASKYGYEVSCHLSTGADNALHRYGDARWPDFDKVR